MRKSLYVLLIGGLLLSGSAVKAFASPPSDPTFMEADKVNNTAYNQKSAYRRIKLVRYANRNLPLPASGDAIAYSSVSRDGTSVIIAGLPANAGNPGTKSADGAFAGIACTAPSTSADGSSTTFADDAGRGNWFYIVIYGPASAKAAAGGTNGNIIGDPVIISSDAGAVTTIENRTGATASTNAVISASASGGWFMLSSDGTSTVYDVFVDRG